MCSVWNRVSASGSKVLAESVARFVTFRREFVPFVGLTRFFIAPAPLTTRLGQLKEFTAAVADGTTAFVASLVRTKGKVLL